MSNSLFWNKISLGHTLDLERTPILYLRHLKQVEGNKMNISKYIAYFICIISTVCFNMIYFKIWFRYLRKYCSLTDIRSGHSSAFNSGVLCLLLEANMVYTKSKPL